MSQVKTSTKYRVHADKVLPFTHQEGSIVDAVPVGYYKVDFHPFVGYHLTRISETIELPSNIFGSANKRADRIFESYDSSPASLGVGLFGKKGAGKSLLASVIGARGLAQGLPVIDVSESFKTDPDYLNFLNSLDECVIIFDEFLKHLSKLKVEGEELVSSSDHQERRFKARDRQEEMLTFFQGAQNTKRLIVLIDNERHMLSEFLQERPGRMRYIWSYDGVEREVVEQLAKHHGLSDVKTQAATVYALRFKVSFDVINEVIKEWVRYPDETLEQITLVLNVPTLAPEVTYKARVVKFTSEEGDILKSELCTVSSRGQVTIQIEERNPYYGKPKLTEAQFEDDDDTYFPYNYEFYLENLDKPMYEGTRHFDDNYLVALKGNQQIYQTPMYTVGIEIIERSVNNVSSEWGVL